MLPRALVSEQHVENRGLYNWHPLELYAWDLGHNAYSFQAAVDSFNPQLPHMILKFVLFIAAIGKA
mgnify:CR=1 FL=1